MPVLGVIVWFDCEFSKRFCAANPVVMSTSPHGTPTHWAQTLLNFKVRPERWQAPTSFRAKGTTTRSDRLAAQTQTRKEQVQYGEYLQSHVRMDPLCISARAGSYLLAVI